MDNLPVKHQEQGALVPYNQLKEMAKDVTASGMFGVKNEAQATALMLLCQAEGLHPVMAMRRYHIMNTGRPAMRAEAMLAEYQARGGRVTWEERNQSVVRATFTNRNGESLTVEWTIAMAKDANLLGNQTWGKYPRQMLTARVISEGVRTMMPEVVVGIYTPEEIEDMEPVEVHASPAIEMPRRASEAQAIEAEVVEQPAKVEMPKRKSKTQPSQPEQPAWPVEEPKDEAQLTASGAVSKTHVKEVNGQTRYAMMIGPHWYVTTDQDYGKIIEDSKGSSFSITYRKSADGKMNEIVDLEALPDDGPDAAQQNQEDLF
jgi:hypothetical protein